MHFRGMMLFNFDTHYLNLPKPFYSLCKAESVEEPTLMLWNEALAERLGLDRSAYDDKGLADLFVGNITQDHSTPFAQAYAGHQFGHFTMLGDGRALILGEHVTPAGQRFDIQLKGSGRTPYSRSGDGRAPLKAVIREYLISEAMAGLGIQTTRALAVVKTGENVMRQTVEPGGVLTRIAKSHIRVGTFEFAAAKGDVDLVSALLDFTIERHYPHLKDADNKAEAFLKAVMEAQINLITDWMRVGFIHGVMNTDNVSIAGETIDFGPCAFMDSYDPKTVFSSIDRHGRYAFANQPRIAGWNLARLAEALLPLINEDMEQAAMSAEAILEGFEKRFEKQWLSMMAHKLGLSDADRDETKKLITDFLNLLEKETLDYTNSFYALRHEASARGFVADHPAFKTWYERWSKAVRGDENSKALRQASNPVLIPRNHIVEGILEKAEAGDLDPLHDFLNAFQSPYEDKNDIILSRYQSPPREEERVLQTFCGT